MIDLDVHAHLVPVGIHLEGAAGVEWDVSTETLVVDGDRVGVADLFHSERLIAWMDRHEIRRALISIPPPLYRQHLDAPHALQWARRLNVGLAGLVASSQGRLGALFHLPAEHPALCEPLVREHANGAEGFAMAAGGDPRIVLSEGSFSGLWQALHERRAFVLVHPGRCCDARLKPFYLENLVGNPMETGIAAAHLVMAGVPSSFPDIRFCLAHAGGVFPIVCGRLERGFDTGRPGVLADRERPLQAARRFYCDGIGHHPGALRLAREVFGDDHVLFGSDWPFPMGIPAPTGD